MELVERYIYAVAQRVPLKQREEIAHEVRSLIEDMLEQRLGDREPSKEDVQEILLALGDPAALADQYRGFQRYLIGPELFDSYWAVLKIVLFSIGIAAVVGFFAQLFIEPTAILEHFVSALVLLLTVGFQGIAWVTIIFGLIEYRRMQKGHIETIKKESWEISELPDLPDNKLIIKPSEPIFGIVFSILFLMFFIFSADLIGIPLVIGGATPTIISVFHLETLQSYLPIIYLLVGLGILKESLKLIYKKWTLKLANLSLVLNILTFGMIFIIFTDPALWNPDFMLMLVDAGVLVSGSEAYDTVNRIWQLTTNSIIFFIAIIYLIETVAMYTRLLTSKQLQNLHS